MFQELEINPEKIESKINYDEILKLRVMPSLDIPKPEVVLFFGDEMVMTRKNISCITGKAKVGKSFLMTLLCTSVLNKGNYNSLQSFLPKGRDKIIYIDTEQSDYHILLILKRIQDIVTEHKIDNLMMFNFDSLNTNERREFVKELIYKTPGVGLVVIDGIADLIFDTNDIRESSLIVSDLRKWATETDVHIVNVIHQNPSENSKMRGHLGTILTNKAETVIQIKSSEENEAIKIVETLATRNKKPEAWSFEIIEGVPEIIEYTPEVKQGRPKIKQLSDIEKLELLSEVYTNYKGEGLGYTVLIEKTRLLHQEKHGHIGIVNIKELLRYCKEMYWITQDGNKSNYFFNNPQF